MAQVAIFFANNNNNNAIAYLEPPVKPYPGSTVIGEFFNKFSATILKKYIKFPAVYFLEHLCCRAPPGHMVECLRLKFIFYVCRDHCQSIKHSCFG